MMKSIYLIGMMGSGKTSTARELGILLQMPVIDLDLELERQTGKRIAEIFREKGEPWFRGLESQVLTGHLEEAIYATGGGAILAPQNRGWMRARGTVVFLETSPEQLWARVSRESGRPLLEGSDPKRSLLSIATERKPLYEECAHFTVLTDYKSPREVASEIHKQVNLKNQ